MSFSYTWGPPSAPHPQVKAGCTHGLILSRHTETSFPFLRRTLPTSLHEKLPASLVLPGRAASPSPAPSILIYASPPGQMGPFLLPRRRSRVPGIPLQLGSQTQGLGAELSGPGVSQCPIPWGRARAWRGAGIGQELDVLRDHRQSEGQPGCWDGASLSRHSRLLFCTGASGGAGGEWEPPFLLSPTQNPFPQRWGRMG